MSVWRPSKLQKKLIEEPRDVQLEIERFLIEILNNTNLVSYEHYILRGVVHVINETKVKAKKEEFKEGGRIIKKISIEFLSGFIEIPLGNFVSVKINLYQTTRKEYPGMNIPIDIALNYGVFSKRSGVVSAKIVGTVVFKITKADRYIKIIQSFSEKFPDVFSILSEAEEIEIKKEEEELGRRVRHG